MQHLGTQGFHPSHLDSHHHIHTIRWMLPVVLGLQRRHAIRKLRNTMNVYGLGGDGGKGNGTPSLRLRTAKSAWRLASRLGGSRLPQVFTGLHIFLADPSRAEFLSAASIELMCHPGQGGFETETTRLLDPSRPLLDGRYRLRTYNDLLA
ncbi:ChbG/HpnK family deacetylase [Synechococcus sp. CCY 9618]|uniref:ChbG/HpnK family deacetylase n=1 Tax=Synechococcus sp. CCY 9618 TaxID=2815602 RepID=UPI00352F200D